MVKQAHIYISNGVIGIGFRAWVKLQAQKHGVFGWVKNTFDKPDIFGKSGGVEIVAKGEEKNIASFIKRIELGNVLSSIKKIKTSWETSLHSFDDFTIIL